MTQEQLAASVNVATETISRLERGVSMPSLMTLEKISHALHSPLNDPFDFEYPKSKGDAFENEIDKLIAFLKTRDSDDIKMCYQMLKIIFGQIEKTTTIPGNQQISLDRKLMMMGSLRPFDKRRTGLTHPTAK